MGKLIEADLTEYVGAIFRAPWERQNSLNVPDPEDLSLGNHGVNLDAAVLYADMKGSTALVDNTTAEFAAEVYKTYLMCSARIIKNEGGSITAYDGDRIMAAFVGDQKRTTAARTALKINYAVKKIINPALHRQYPLMSDFKLEHVVGVDCSKLLAARIGVRNDNDLVWVGRAANHAAKLTELNDDGYSIFITASVFNGMNDLSKFGGTPRRMMWEKRGWPKMAGAVIYRSNWMWPA
jgi:class 3 adenylate cyclase